MRKALWAAAAASVALVSTAAWATVTFDPDSGTGFVGKGDVQLAFGWNNSQAQKNANGVTFTYESDQSYDVTCEWTTLTGGKNSKTIYHDVTNHKSTSVSSTIAYDARMKNQYTGYNLLGLGSTVTTGTPVPNIGDPCPQGGGLADSDPPGNDAVVTDVEIDPASVVSGFFVNFNGNKAQLNWPIVV